MFACCTAPNNVKETSVKYDGSREVVHDQHELGRNMSVQLCTYMWTCHGRRMRPWNVPSFKKCSINDTLPVDWEWECEDRKKWQKEKKSNWWEIELDVLTSDSYMLIPLGTGWIFDYWRWIGLFDLLYLWENEGVCVCECVCACISVGVAGGMKVSVLQTQPQERAHVKHVQLTLIL